jgi:hypothetical protein
MTIARHSQRPVTRRLVREVLRRDPEDRWAAAFGRIAGSSFAVAVVTGVLLLPFFRPSMAPVVYRGSYRLLDGVPVSQEVPVVRKTAKWIYYTSDTWDRVEAVVSPGCISRQEFETDTRCRRHGYPAGVIPVPGARPGSAGRLFFATRQAAEYHLYRGEHERAGQAARDASRVKALRRAMADAHPDRGGTAEQFIEARHRYQTALRSALA